MEKLMKRFMVHFEKHFYLFLILLFAGCASIVAGGPQTIPIKSSPSGAKVTIINLRTGNAVVNAMTPATIALERGAGYFKKARYNVVVEKEGFMKKEFLVEGDVNLWYIGGNLIFGGLIGWVIVDPLTGAMWTLNPKDVNADLMKEVSLFKENKGLMIVLTTELPELPESVRAKMTPMNVQ